MIIKLNFLFSLPDNKFHTKYLRVIYQLLASLPAYERAWISIFHLIQNEPFFFNQFPSTFDQKTLLILQRETRSHEPWTSDGTCRSNIRLHETHYTGTRFILMMWLLYTLSLHADFTAFRIKMLQYWKRVKTWRGSLFAVRADFPPPCNPAD